MAEWLVNKIGQKGVIREGLYQSEGKNLSVKKGRNVAYFFSKASIYSFFFRRLSCAEIWAGK